MARVRKWLPLSAIRIDRIPLNRSTLALVDFLRNGGEVKPIKVQKIRKCPVCNDPRCDAADGHYEYHIRDGRHRWVAYKILGHTHIEVVFGESTNA